ncbi:MAG: cysteine--tRNA ligase [Chlamydiae bacterium RIFCSPHIGHO2_12_FULL_44_59]|nr:MAG: cysteine--tRNA ligase [Chlamydiae bacterium RIFCSPHIGHO2_01_FULL_44_39]OGN59168.1 MAG: cysteine--tRNA ligase [Chlamydiae bacterium RIFCSPHIGHO2_02_FULL_45_9]OGN60835.1 MAG: cysteine--tRNA ligase [Chlamydiae bacterium RIFCSPHIGHO2_12_FULL_44_59]OGN66711.1 MAG: cysteine--tRNA ligase [Chlamydiae bacterium RIFCSPLOWO2_01_FULL_44_52]OGN67361.1 MAG: cysteine--tRNA ligase [Chlamydiae bacterium RIFCSPLOWO2_02_FULL_45_22]OGN70636.1 MAG: cysteine--tRNA ligase [Chlamydiae bacterium RIFCSPLOWO2_12
MLKIFNTETRQKEELYVKNRRMKMYTCGPTIYDFAHIGNFRTYVFEDLLRRSLFYFGFQVEQAMNLTDVDDKTIRGALQKKISLHEYTEPFKQAFFEDLKTLNIQKVEHYPSATDFIPQMIQMIQKLIQKGYVYEGSDGSLYFSIAKFPSYGRLSHLNLKELKGNASGENSADEYDKDHVADFVLWKAYHAERDGNIFWESPFGRGRPGWHIECSAMATALLGDSIDIHCGGVDNMFPHHENEIAQSEGCTGCHFVRLWVHVEHLLVNHKKMSKSLGNFYTLRDLQKQGYSGAEVRYLLLSTHYRTQLNFTLDGLEAARASLKRVHEISLRLRSIQGERPEIGLLEKAKLCFQEALSDDLNISSALAALFNLIRELNTAIDNQKLGQKEACLALSLFQEWDQVLAVLPLEKKEEEVPLELLDMLKIRDVARREKNWALSDQMRDAILKKGYIIEDTPQGSKLKNSP